jgi:hypothetical protein
MRDQTWCGALACEELPGLAVRTREACELTASTRRSPTRISRRRTEAVAKALLSSENGRLSGADCVRIGQLEAIARARGVSEPEPAL